MKVPIACSLPDDAARGQVGEWHELLATSVAVDRTSPTEVSVRLRAEPSLLVAAIQLAQREKACCPFFDFTLRIEAEAFILHVNAPEDAARLLDGFTGESS